MHFRHDELLVRSVLRPGKEGEVDVITAEKAVIPAEDAEKALEKRISYYNYRLQKMREDTNHDEHK